MTIASLTAVLVLSLGAGTPPPVVMPGVCAADPARWQSQRQTLDGLVGEWEGEFRVTNERGTSVSMVGLSAQRETLPGEESGGVLMAFQGLAFATPIDGVARLTLDEPQAQITSTWYDTLMDTGVSFTSVATVSPSVCALTLQSFTLESDEVLSQTITLESQDHAVIHIMSQSPGEPARTILSMNLYRLPVGQVSMGAGMLTDAALLARLDSMQTNTATANVNPDAE